MSSFTLVMFVLPSAIIALAIILAWKTAGTVGREHGDPPARREFDARATPQ